ncbi:DUF2244 domain-containing protein [Methylopila musalis]|uniref:DUF2244 domain-containing protein n=1 Tax=Methylopila musalis TaxID=1134781 RepID=A0ABW3Z7C0_9HYPH
MASPASPEHAADRQVFAAEITPHRSLSDRGARILVLGFGALSAVVSLPFFLMGAWPVVGFFGLDVLLLWLALRSSFAQARACERIALTYVELTISRVTHRGERRDWRMNPLWTRIESETDDEFGMTRLAVRERRTAVDLAQALSPAERAQFADAFGAALAVAKAGPRAAAE